MHARIRRRVRGPHQRRPESQHAARDRRAGSACHERPAAAEEAGEGRLMSTTERTYTALFPFGGIGGGALGFAQAHAELLGCRARFEVLGGIDFDAGACADFEYLTEKPSLEADIANMTPDELRAFAGPK